MVELPKDLFPGYRSYWAVGTRPGYSGLLTLIKEEPGNVWRGLHDDDPDDEGRVMTLDLGKIYLINSYFPNSSQFVSISACPSKGHTGFCCCTCAWHRAGGGAFWKTSSERNAPRTLVLRFCVAGAFWKLLSMPNVSKVYFRRRIPKILYYASSFSSRQFFRIVADFKI